MKTKLIAIFAALLILLTFSCNKDEMDLATDSIAQTEERSKDDMKPTIGKDVDEEEFKNYVIAQRSMAYSIFNDYLEKGKPGAEYGLPNYYEMITFKSSASQSHNILPLIDERTQEVRSLMFIQIHNNKYAYTHLTQKEVKNNASYTFTVDGIEKEMTNNDLKALFGAIKCAIFDGNRDGNWPPKWWPAWLGDKIDCFDDWGVGTDIWGDLQDLLETIFTNSGDEFPEILIVIGDLPETTNWNGNGWSGTIPTGGGSPPPPPYYNQLIRLSFCETNVDPYDVDEFGGGNANAVHPDEAFCSNWNLYFAECIQPNIDYTDPTIYTDLTDEQETMNTWAENLYENHQLFEEMITQPIECISDDEFDCESGGNLNGLLAEYMANHNLELTKLEQDALLDENTPCDSYEEFSDYICGAILDKEVEKMLENYPFDCSVDNPQDLLTKVAEGTCPVPEGINPIELFYHELKGDIIGDHVKMGQSSDQEIIDNILNQIKWANYQFDCNDVSYNNSTINFNEFMTNGLGWLADDVEGEACSNDFYSEIKMSFAMGGACMECMQFSQCSVTPLPPDYSTVRIDFISCIGDCGPSTPCMALYMPNSVDDEFIETYLRFCD